MAISLGGLLLHMKLHPVTKSLYFWWASPMSAFSLIIISLLYSRRTTAAWGFLFNGIAVAAGTIGMCYYSILNLEPPYTVSRILFASTLPAILVLWLKVPLACVILRQMRPKTESSGSRGCEAWQK